jgi:hypothetical protein
MCTLLRDRTARSAHHQWAASSARLAPRITCEYVRKDATHLGTGVVMLNLHEYACQPGANSARTCGEECLN